MYAPSFNALPDVDTELFEQVTDDELALRISTRRMPREMSTCSVIAPSTGLIKVGQPLPWLGPSWTRLEELLAANEERMRRA